MLGWSEEENTRLCSIVKSYVEDKGFSPDGLSLYQRIAPMFPGHQFQELRRYYLKTLRRGGESLGPAVAPKTKLSPSQTKTQSGSSQTKPESQSNGKPSKKQGSKATPRPQVAKELRTIDEPTTEERPQQREPEGLDPIGDAGNVEEESDTELIDVVGTDSAQTTIPKEGATPLEEDMLLLGDAGIADEEKEKEEMKNKEANKEKEKIKEQEENKENTGKGEIEEKLKIEEKEENKEGREVKEKGEVKEKEAKKEKEMDQLSDSGFNSSQSNTTRVVGTSETKMVVDLSSSFPPQSPKRPRRQTVRKAAARRNVAVEKKNSSEDSDEDSDEDSGEDSDVYSSGDPDVDSSEDSSEDSSVYPCAKPGAPTLQPSVNQPLLPPKEEDTADCAQNSQPKSLQAHGDLTQEAPHVELVRNKPLSEATSALCMESVDMLSRLTGQDRNAVLHGLLVSSGDVRIAFDYLCRRNPKSTWSYDEDMAILNRQEDKLHLMIETKSLDEIAARFGFLTSLCEAPPV